MIVKKREGFRGERYRAEGRGYEMKNMAEGCGPRSQAISKGGKMSRRKEGNGEEMILGQRERKQRREGVGVKKFILCAHVLPKKKIST